MAKLIRFYINAEAEYDWEADLIDEISAKHGPYHKKWDFASPEWAIERDDQLDEFVLIKLFSTKK